MMGGARRHGARPQPRHPRPEQRRQEIQQSQRPQHQPRPQQPRPQSKPADPIVSKPYEPGTATAVAKVAEPTVHSKRRERPVAALLGGLKRA